MSIYTKIDLPPDGKCPMCENVTLVVAEDVTQYREWAKRPGGWEQMSGPTSEVISDMDPLGATRMFCAECGQHFNFPEDLK